MKKSNVAKITFVAGFSLITLLLLSRDSRAQSTDVRGVINGRRGPTMTLQTQDGGNLTIILNDYTQVEDVQGFFHARKTQMGVTALIPGLPVEVKGSYNAQSQLVADTVKFKSADLKAATDMQAGIAPVEQQQQAAAQESAKQQAQIQQQQKALVQQQQAMDKEQQEMAAAQAKIAAEKAAIAAVNKRFGELGDYNIWDEVTVYFANGKVNVEQQYQPKLLALCQKAKTVTGYVIQAKGYASSVGSAALNQKLSQERAANVIDFLEQSGGIPLTNILAPGAMGTSRQVAPDATAEGQAENRRVVVRVLQNKGIAGS